MVNGSFSRLLRAGYRAKLTWAYAQPHHRCFCGRCSIVIIIGLTGGIASGKSVVARRLAELGAFHVDADVLAREVVEPGSPGLAAITARFGDGVLTEDGRLDRAALGAIIFSDEKSRLALNQITHPAVWARARGLFRNAAQHDPRAIVIYDVPLLVESSTKRPINFDRIVVVHADKDVRLRRLTEIRGMSVADAERRIGAQATDAERLAVADVVINTNGTMEETIRQVDELWHSLLRL
ncbi:MAG: dephospho-CoA kinase [Glaciihabitans sp.]|nr:dephospho-CoA kinase [Glaciihabitans sp.]